eukprot:7069272-Prymnesium_polylepis.1
MWCRPSPAVICGAAAHPLWCFMVPPIPCGDLRCRRPSPVAADVECVLKLTALGHTYFLDNWCRFDFFLVITSLIDQ